MRAAIVVPPRGFKDETVSFFKEFFQKWGIETSIASYSEGEVKGYHGAVYAPEINAHKVNPADFDILLVAEGPGVEAYKLYDFRPLLDLVKSFSSAKRTIIGFGNSFNVIARANAINGVKVSVPENEEAERLMRIYHGIKSDDAIEFDKNIVTAKDSDNTLEVAKLILEHFGLK